MGELSKSLTGLQVNWWFSWDHRPLPAASKSISVARFPGSGKRCELWEYFKDDSPVNTTDESRSSGGQVCGTSWKNPTIADRWSWQSVGHPALMPTQPEQQFHRLSRRW